MGTGEWTGTTGGNWGKTVGKGEGNKGEGRKKG